MLAGQPPLLKDSLRFTRSAHPPPSRPPKSWKPQFLPFDHTKLPALPLITDDALADSVITFHAKDGTEPMRSLALEGDAVIDLAVTEFIQDSGYSRPEVVSLLRSILTRNVTLSYLSLAYRLVPHLVAPTEPPSRYSRPDHLPWNQKVAADAFEAYVGAVHRIARKAGRRQELYVWLGTLFSDAVWPGLRAVRRALDRCRLKGIKAGKAVAEACKFQLVVKEGKSVVIVEDDEGQVQREEVVWRVEKKEDGKEVIVVEDDGDGRGCSPDKPIIIHETPDKSLTAASRTTTQRTGHRPRGTFSSPRTPRRAKSQTTQPPSGSKGFGKTKTAAERKKLAEKKKAKHA